MAMRKEYKTKGEQRIYVRIVLTRSKGERGGVISAAVTQSAEG